MYGKASYGISGLRDGINVFYAGKDMNTKEREIARKAFTVALEKYGHFAYAWEAWQDYAKTLEASEEGEPIPGFKPKGPVGGAIADKPQLPEALKEHSHRKYDGLILFGDDKSCNKQRAWYEKKMAWQREHDRLMLEEVKKIAGEEAYQRGCQCQSQINLHYEQACDTINGVERAFEKLEKRLLAEMGQANVEHNLHMQEVEKRLEAKIDAAISAHIEAATTSEQRIMELKGEIVKAAREASDYQVSFYVGAGGDGRTVGLVDGRKFAEKLSPPDSHDEEKRKEAQHMATAIFGGREE